MVLMAVIGVNALQAAENDLKPRLVVCTDIAPADVEPDYVKSRAVMGSIHGGIKAIGADNDSPGSELLIRLADEDDTRPIYVAAWGGANTLAQAIWQQHKDNIQGRGALGGEYPTYKWGVEGDTPSFLYVMPKATQST